MTADRASVVQERILPAPPDEVFAAWSDPESLRRWMCPGEIRSADVEVDFRVGGRFRVVMHGAREYAHHGEYLEIVPPRRLVFTWVSEFLPEAEAHTRVTVTLEPIEATRTHIRLVHDLLPAGDAYAGHAQGWEDILRKLDAVLGGVAEEARR
jgi:uncharacterized protein YndB with AHSA1/START domain